MNNKTEAITSEEIFTNIDSLFEDISEELEYEVPELEVKLSKTKTSIIIDWLYNNNSKFDIHDGQIAVSKFIYQFANVRPTWFSGSENLSIIRVI